MKSTLFQQARGQVLYRQIDYQTQDKTETKKTGQINKHALHGPKRCNIPKTLVQTRMWNVLQGIHLLQHQKPKLHKK